MTETHKKSTHRAEVVPVVLEPHPNADTLSIVRVWGYSCCVRTSDWVGIDRAVYLVPDSVVDVRRPEFSFLVEQAKGDMTARIKAKKLRGVVSYGLLIPAPDGTQVGDDLADVLGVTRYEPPEPGESGDKKKLLIGGEEEAGPDLDTGPGKYDVESFERYAHILLTPGEPVYISEKLDGSNVRFVYWNDRFWVKSRARWVKRLPDYSHINVKYLVDRGVEQERAEALVEGLKQKVEKNIPNSFWQALEATPNLMEYLKGNPGTTVFGEVYGATNHIKYGFPDGNRFAAFDVYQDGKFLDAEQMLVELEAAGVPTVPYFNDRYGYDLWEVEPIPYSFEVVKEMAEGTSLSEGAKAGTIREGVVIRPMQERFDDRLGRVILKCVSPTFLEKS